ncbi:MAG: hypothetical protein ACI9LV_000223 [Candidatus Nanohaloarchaea archaeon]|jgi:uncharacterized protein (TIRG00374 family)
MEVRDLMDNRLVKALWFGVSTAILGFVIYLADISLFMSALASADIFYLLPALVFGLLPFAVYGFTWYRFLNRVGENISYPKSVRMLFGGQFMNAITPVGQFGGEPFMAYVIKENTDLKYEEAFSTVLSADIVNAIPTFTFVAGGAIYLLFLGGLQDFLLQLLALTGLVLVLGGSIAYVLWFKSGTIEGAILRIIRLIVDLTGRGENVYIGVQERFRGVQDAFETIGGDPKYLVLTAVIIHTEFILRVICLYLVLASLGISSDLTPIYFVLAFAGIANFAPTPGGSGAYEVTQGGLISLFIGVDLATAIAASVLFRLTNYWASMIIGYVSLLTLRGGK